MSIVECYRVIKKDMAGFFLWEYIHDILVIQNNSDHRPT